MEKLNIYIVCSAVALSFIFISYRMIREAMKEDKKEWNFKERDESLYRRLECECDEPSPIFFNQKNMCEDCFNEIIEK